MVSSSSNLIDNLAEGISNSKCKNCDYFLEHASVKDNLVIYKCYKDYSNKLDEKLKKVI